MSSHDSDISWQLLRQIVQDWAGTSAELAEVKQLEGGVINTTLGLTLADGTRAVLKISPHRVNRDYQREAHQLDLLRSLGIPTPRVYRLITGSLDDPHSLILMEFVEGMNLSEAKKCCSPEAFDSLQHELADIVLKMHAQLSPFYCRVTGDEPQTFEKWTDFYRHIYDPIVRDIEKLTELPVKTRKQITKLHDRLDRLIVHDDVPRLVHWDIWGTNLMARCDDSGNWKISAVLDPNCKYAHAEAELAYMDLFHTSTPAFNRAYQRTHRLDEAYHRMRKPIYQLYPLMNHVQLFGHEYVKPLLGALEKCSALI
jgi:fructosamine-3-kinase